MGNYIKALIIAMFFSIFIGTSSPVNANMTLSQDEEDYITNSKTLKAVSIDGAAPLSYTNSKGEIVGISISFLNEVSELTGLSFKFELVKTVGEALASDYDLLFNATTNYVPDHILLSKPYLNTEAIIYMNKSMDLSQIEDKRFAAIQGGTLPEGIKEENVIFFNNRKDTLDAVNKGIADYSYGNAYSIAFYALQNDYPNIITVPTGKEERAYCMGFEKGNEILLSIINKSIDSIGEKRIQTLILDVASQVERNITLPMIVDTYWKEILGIILFVVLVLSYSVYSSVNANKQLKIDIAEIKKREERIRYLSNHDKLTGVYNRSCFEKKLSEYENGDHLPISIIIGDINGLKLINDAFGYQEGDRLLQKAAQILKNTSRPKDILTRYGGDEFAIILPETPYHRALKVCESINELCYKTHKDLIPISISLGCATKSDPNEDTQRLIQVAEDSMYRHKLLEGKSARNSILASLEASLHEKDIETKEHALRLVKTTAKVGERLGLNPNEMDDLNLFARLHDIGKITVDESIINKQGKLTADEFKEIKKHSETGYRIAQSSQILSNIAEYILAHHERWDGKGYPHGLKGEEIPLLSRILAIADAFDAMTNDRPYRKAMNHSSAVDELKTHSGRQFDPKLVPLFIETIKDI